jgi:RND family efflux transporter MFP subunit
VRGTIDLINFKEGELVKEGAVVAEVSKDRYTAVVGEFQGNYQAIERSLVKAREDLSVQEELHNRRAGNWSDLVRARSDVAILEARKEEAAFKLRQAELNLKACIIKAPFSGTIAVFYHEPFETVDNLEKIFNVIDIDKVYARVNWPEARVDELTPGRRAVFVYQGKEYEGVLEKVSPLIDPAPKAKRVHVVLNNPGGKLQVGMSGSLRFKEGSKLSQRSDE